MLKQMRHRVYLNRWKLKNKTQVAKPQDSRVVQPDNNRTNVYIDIGWKDEATRDFKRFENNEEKDEVQRVIAPWFQHPGHNTLEGEKKKKKKKE